MATGIQNLKAYQLSSELEIKVYSLTKDFPDDEKYRSVDQLRRSSSSVTNNIAEAYNRSSIKEKVRILNDIVKGEANETRSNLEMCLKKNFHKNTAVIERYTELLKALSGYISFLRNQEKLKNLSTSKLTN